MQNIKDLFGEISKTLFTTDGKLTYSEVQDKLILLCDLLIKTEIDVWNLGECDDATLPDLIIGAYWFFTENHKNQFSKEYECLSALGLIYKPGCSSKESENVAFIANQFEQLSKVKK